jgi:hypothetical protein
VHRVKQLRPIRAVLWRGATVTLLVIALIISADAGRTGDTTIIAVLLVPALVLFAAAAVSILHRR